MTEYETLCDRLDTTITTAEKLGVSMHAWLSHPGQATTCTENINHAAVVGVDGSLSPCVYARLPVTDSV
ncbi:MAG: hypothetical protein AB7U29_10475 [Desulfobulbus sp.]